MSYQQNDQNKKQKTRDIIADSFPVDKFDSFVNDVKNSICKNTPNRIGWDEYFMELAFLVRRRSPDAQTQHGAVIVDKNKRVISSGYNGFPSGGPDHLIPNLRPDKYDFIIHAEMNAILSAKQDLADCTIYVTGVPCKSCFLHIVGSGIRDIVFGDIPYHENEKDLIPKAYLYSLYDINLWKYDNDSGEKIKFSYTEGVA